MTKRTVITLLTSHRERSRPRSALRSGIIPTAWQKQPSPGTRPMELGEGGGGRPLHWRGGSGMPVAGCLQPSDPVTFALLCAHLRRGARAQQH